MKRLSLTILLLALSLSGCINYEQDTYINEDRSGHLDIRISICPKEFMSNLVSKAAEDSGAGANLKTSMRESMSKATPDVKCDVKEEDLKKGFAAGSVKNITFKKVEGDGVIHFCFGADFDDIATLYDDKDRIRITEDEGGRVTYTEHFKSSDAEAAGAADADKYYPDIFKGYHFRYTLHMPREIVSANTDKVDKTTATWEIPMPEAMRQKDLTVTVTIAPQNKILKWRDGILKKKSL